MTGIVANLEARGLVARRPWPVHARVHLLSLTPAGLALAERPAEIAPTAGADADPPARPATSP